MSNPEQTPKGRLELTWANKGQRLIARDGGTYEWVPTGDYRAREVRLLRDAGSVGEVATGPDAPLANLLIRGDSLHALNALATIPAYADELVGKVKLIYIDPPFNTGEAFSQYDDGLEHSVWLTMMRDRLIQLRQLLAPDGSIWVHLDDNEMAYCRVLMDEIFGRDNFVATIVWQKVHARDNRTSISTSQDYMLVFAANPSIWRATRNLLDRGEAGTNGYKNPDNDPRGLWTSDNFSAQAAEGRRASQFYTLRTPAGLEFEPTNGRCWLYTQERYEELVADNRVWFGVDGQSGPRLKRFLSEVQDGLVPVSWWPHEEVGHNQAAKKEILALFPDGTPFATPKPERFMERVIQIATDPGDIVLDCFAGSGTTAAVAHKMGRRWVVAEWSKDTLENFIVPRLTKVVGGTDAGGITSHESVEPEVPLDEPIDRATLRRVAAQLPDLVKTSDVEQLASLSSVEVEAVVATLKTLGKVSKRTETRWEGGGGFRVLDVAPSMFEDDGGVVVLADWATDHALAEAVAAQLGFDYALEAPFCGRKGRTRLAVIDGHLTVDTAKVLVSALGDGETLSVVSVGLDPEAAEWLRKARRGSQARVAPRDLLTAYASPASWRVTSKLDGAAEAEAQLTLDGESAEATP